MTRSVAFVGVVLALSLGVFIASPSDATPVSTVTLSDLSSEETGGPCTGPPNTCTDIVLAAQLDARLEFTVADNGPDLDITLKLYNDTTAPYEFKINEVFFNLSGISSIAAGSLNGWSFSTDDCPVGSSTSPTGDDPCNDVGGAGERADGFGIFDVALKIDEASGLAAGSDLSFTFTAAGAAGTMAEAFTTAVSRDSEAGGLFLSVAAAKFVQGPQTPCDDQDPESNICDSGYGAGSPGLTPEPGNLVLAFAGLAGILLMGRRSR